MEEVSYETLNNIEGEESMKRSVLIGGLAVFLLFSGISFQSCDDGTTPTTSTTNNQDELKKQEEQQKLEEEQKKKLEEEQRKKEEEEQKKKEQEKKVVAEEFRGLYILQSSINNNKGIIPDSINSYKALIGEVEIKNFDKIAESTIHEGQP